ncbi:MAG TPA: phosphopyruvate hydratase, partial [Candidatus Nanoarchaeia archaeon]|nr:phosphopyruvate hydratase [Candidatus Nanoarchaeia archaeon]
MTIVKKILGRQILDSRGNPTVEVELWTASGRVRASIPSGASTGKHEAVELRDNAHAYHGKGVLQAVSHVNKIGKDFIGKKLDLKAIDHHLIHSDTANKSRLGANATLGISLAALKAVACSNEEPLYKTVSRIAKTKVSMPKPMFNIINGGVHAGNQLDVQEYMVVPQSKSFSENLRIG